MARKRFTPEQIIGKLREAEVLLAQGEKMGVVCKRIAVTEQTYGGVKAPPCRGVKKRGDSLLCPLFSSGRIKPYGPVSVRR